MKIRVLLVLAAACAGPAQESAAVPRDVAQACVVPEDLPESSRVDGLAARKLIAQGARLVDVRAPDFYNKEHIQGAINIPVAQVEARAASEIGPVNTPVVLYCRTGAGSARAASILKKMGYVYVYDLGSYLNWGEGAPAPTPLPPAS